MTNTNCPICGKQDTMRPFEGPVKVRGFAVLANGERCGSCGEVLFDLAEVKRQEKLVAAMIVERGIRTGTEFQFVRKIIGIKATELALLLGVRAETISRWERGGGPVDRAAAFALGELHERPRIVRAKLEAMAS